MQDWFLLESTTNVQFYCITCLQLAKPYNIKNDRTAFLHYKRIMLFSILACGLCKCIPFLMNRWSEICTYIYIYIYIRGSKPVARRATKGPPTPCGGAP